MKNAPEYRSKSSARLSASRGATVEKGTHYEEGKKVEPQINTDKHSEDKEQEVEMFKIQNSGEEVARGGSDCNILFPFPSRERVRVKVRGGIESGCATTGEHG